MATAATARQEGATGRRARAMPAWSEDDIVQAPSEAADLALQWRDEVVPLSELHIPDYQRGIQYSLVKRIVADYDKRLMQPMTVNRRADGLLYVIDGFQRLTALRQLGRNDRALRVLLYQGLTREEEAFIYSMTQMAGTRRILLPIQQFKGALAYGDPEALAVQGAVEATGLSIDEHRPSEATNLAAVAAARRIVRRALSAQRAAGATDPDWADAQQHLTRVLGIVCQAYPLNETVGVTVQPNRRRLNAMNIVGVSYFLHHYGDAVEERRLIDKLRQAGLEELRDQVGNYRRIVHTGRWELAVARAILHLYNAGRGGGNLPEWIEPRGQVA